MESKSRIEWIDQVKGLTIFLVVYGHNFPLHEKYIYSFHMPLFILLSGFFQNNQFSWSKVRKRWKQIMFPYFIWAFLLFFVWYIIGRNYGESNALNLSVTKNFIGIFYAQGGRAYMDWGIPLWFLPSIFLTYFFFTLTTYLKENKILQYFILFLLIVFGFLWSRIIKIHLPWSIDVALVSLFFYAFGHFIFPFIQNIEKRKAIVFFIIFGFLNLFLFQLNQKVDMYRSIYGNEFLFLINGITGSLFIIFLLKSFPVFKFLGFIGKFSMVILALQLLAMSTIKIVIMILTQTSVFDFSEIEKFVYSLVQIILLIPVFYFINLYFPLLNGGYKKI